MSTITSQARDVASENLQATFGKQQTNSKSKSQSSKQIEMLNKQSLNMLPPEVEGPNFGHLFIEMQKLDWLQYDGQNYLEEGATSGKCINHLFANIKFWGDRTRGVFLKMLNGMKKNESVTNKFKYDIKCPEKTFEKYLDDMGVLVVDFFDTEKNQNIGTSKIMLKLYIKRSFPITLTGNQNVKIGQFSLSIVSSFASPVDASQNKTNQMKSRQNFNLDDSFEENEKIAQNLTQQEKNQRIIGNVFTDDRIPSSYQGQKDNSSYKSKEFLDYDLDEKPTRDRPKANDKQSNIDKIKAGKENQRNKINIDENEDTYSNQADIDKIFARGERLRNQMNQALDSDNAWQTLHGQHEVPKRYVPPFLKEEAKQSIEDAELENIYAVEVEGYNLRESQELRAQRDQDQSNNIQVGQNYQRQETQHIRDMKFIRIKIGSLRIEDEALLHSLIDDTFTTSVSVPLPDIYQKKISHQLVKLSNYDIVSFNEFVFNNLSLYNFKIDEETFNQLVNAQLVISLDGKNVLGQVSMIKLLMSKSYKLEITVPLEQTITVDEAPASKKKSQQSHDTVNKKGGKIQKPELPKKKEEIKIQPSAYQKQVGHITIEIQLQRGDTESELARDYQLKLQTLQDEKVKDDADRQAEVQKYMKFTHSQEPVFAQLYINIKSIRNLCLNQDGTLNKILHEESFMQRLGMTRNVEQDKDDSQNDIQRVQNKEPKRNLYVQYKAFPALEKLKTNTVWQENTPSFQYRAQFPVIMNPDTMVKLQNFTFILEVWDIKSPAQEEFIGLVKVPLASFCYSMKTTDDQIFSLNFLADQHCLYPMMISDGFLPIYSPRLGINIGELSLTMALGTALQINRQIQKEQDQDKHLIEMNFKAQMMEMMKKKQEEENKLRVQLEMSTKMQLDFQKQQLEENKKEAPPDLERSVTPERLPLHDQLFSGFNSMINRPGSPSHNQQDGVFRNLGNFLRQSLNMSITSRDVDMRKMTQLSSLRKLFEESRFMDVKELNGEEIFPDSVKNFDGSVKKDQFVYCLSQKAEFTLTRSEIQNIQTLMTNITKNDQGNIDIDEIQKSYKQYLKDYDSVQQEIIELLQLFKRMIDKKFDDQDQLEDFVRVIEERSVESKLPVQDLKEILSTYDIKLRDSCYDQLASYFDLDRNDQIHIISFCEYMRNQQVQKLNFLKIHPSIFSNRIISTIREVINVDDQIIQQLENEFKIECHKILGKSGVFEDIPDDILLAERINAKLFLSKLRSINTSISLWEIFCFFEHLNTQYAKLYYEPQRYHHILFAHLYKFITNQDYEQKVKQIIQEKQRLIDEEQRRLDDERNMIKASTESIFALAQDINKRNKQSNSESDDGIYSSKGELQSQMSDEEVIIDKKDKKKRGHSKRKEMTFINKKGLDDDEEEIDKRDVSVQLSKARTATLGDLPDENRPYKKIKHIFEIKVKELKNIPILDKLIKDFQRNEQAQNITVIDRATQKKQVKSKNEYIQNVAVKYTFPLDDDQVFQSDYIQLDNEILQENNQFDYKVSINTVHNYIISKEDTIQSHLNNQSNTSDQLFNITLVIYDNNKEYVIGNAQLPIEDLVDQIDLYNSANNIGLDLSQKQTLSRILFIYGTTFSQRENCIIGKMQIEINYQTERQYITQDHHSSSQNQADDKIDDQLQSCFLHKETYVKRKIPLNGVISVFIESIQNIKESIENIEHFAKIQLSALSQTQELNQKSSKLSGITGTSKRSIINESKEQIDRRRILTQIFKTGLNIAVIGSVFGDDKELINKFPLSKHTTKLLYNTLNPIFNDYFDLNVQMDTKLFDYLNNKKAKFEIRHYIINKNKVESLNAGILSRMQVKKEQTSHRSGFTEDLEEDNAFQNCDYVVIGYVTVPLRNLLASNSGIDDQFVIFDEYKQQMGTLKLRISLNHHSHQRPLYSQEASTKHNNAHTISNNAGAGFKTTMIDRSALHFQSLARSQNGLMNMNDNQMILGINFVELIFKNRDQLFSQAQISQKNNQKSYMYLMFKINGQNYKSKFIYDQNTKESQYLKQLKLKVYEIKKTTLIEFDLANQQEIEETFAKPLEIQLWYTREAVQKYQQLEQETLLGSFFVELNELSKIRNRRLKQTDYESSSFHSHEGYFSLYDYQRDQVAFDRLGCRIFLMKKGNLLIQQILQLLEYDTQLADAEVMFHNLDNINTQIQTQLDSKLKGYVDFEDLTALLQKELQDPQLSIINKLVENLEYKNSEKVYYSPLFGTLSPYFRMVQKFDSFGIVEKFNKEFHNLDHQNNGFLPLTIFRSLLEHELKIKEKIVIDFIQNMREVDSQQNLQSLDVNIQSHSLKNHIDYVTLTRKIAFFFEAKNEKQGQTDRSQVQNESNSEDEVTLRIDIESACKLKNPMSEFEQPNSSVVLRLPYSHCQNNIIETQIIQKSEYPNWQLRGQQVKFQLSQDNLRLIVERPLEFEVYHHNHLSYKNQQSKQLIGVAYLDLSLMVFVDGIYQISGYFHVLNKDIFKDGHSVPLSDTRVLQQNSLGQLKLTIQTNTNLKRLAFQNDNQRTYVRENSPMKEQRQDLMFSSNNTVGYNGMMGYNPYVNQNQMTMSFNRENGLNVFSQTNNQNNQKALSETQQKLQYSFNRNNINLTTQKDDQLMQTHNNNMSELDKLISTLSSKLNSSQPDSQQENEDKEKEDKQDHRFQRDLRDQLQRMAELENQRSYQQRQEQQHKYDYQRQTEMRETHGYNQSQQLINQFSKLTSDLKEKNELLQQQRRQIQQQNVVKEQEFEGSDFDRDEIKNDFDQHQPSYNIFEQNMITLKQQYDQVEGGDLNDSQQDILNRDKINNNPPNQVLYFEEDPLKQSFSPLNFANTLTDQRNEQQKNIHQSVVPPLQMSDVYQKINQERNLNSDSGRQDSYQEEEGLIDDQSQQQLFNFPSDGRQEGKNFGISSGHFNEERKGNQFLNDEELEEFKHQEDLEPVRDSAPATATKKKSIFNLDDDDQDYDPKELERIQKILSSQKK